MKSKSFFPLIGRLLCRCAAMAFAVLTGCSAPLERSVSLNTTLPFYTHRSHSKWMGVNYGEGMKYNTVELPGRSIYWPDTAPAPATLDLRRLYQIEFVETGKRMQTNGKGDIFWSPSLVKITGLEGVLYDASLCQLHGVKMKRTTVNVSHGLPAVHSPHWQARSKQFPNAGFVPGGCCVDENDKLTRTWVCPECRKNEMAWKKACTDGG